VCILSLKIPHTASQFLFSMTRIVLGVLLSIVCLNAIGGGIYGLLGAETIPKEWLQGTPFSSYFIPSVILTVIVGGSHGIAAYSVFFNRLYPRHSSILAGAILIVWILVQVLMIGYVSWLQPTMGVAGVTIVALAALLQGAGGSGGEPRAGGR
jgi:hypothetical protein